MKQILLMSVLVLSSTLFGFKADTAKVVAIVNTASWCPACKKNADRVEKDIVGHYMSNANYQVLVYDLSNKKTKTASMEKLMEAGVDDFARKNKATGLIHFLNAETKEHISTVSVSESTEDIKAAFASALDSTED